MLKMCVTGVDWHCCFISTEVMPHVARLGADPAIYEELTFITSITQRVNTDGCIQFAKNSHKIFLALFHR